MDATRNRLVSGGLTGKVIGAFFDTYNELGHGFLESVYEAALEVRLREAGIGLQRQVPIAVRFHGRVVGEFRADMLVENHLLIEIKAAAQLVPAHEAQLLNYLKATRLRLGLLLNFGPRAEFRRRVFS